MRPIRGKHFIRYSRLLQPNEFLLRPMGLVSEVLTSLDDSVRLLRFDGPVLTLPS